MHIMPKCTSSLCTGHVGAGPLNSHTHAKVWMPDRCCFRIQEVKCAAHSNHLHDSSCSSSHWYHNHRKHHKQGGRHRNCQRTTTLCRVLHIQIVQPKNVCAIRYKQAVLFQAGRCIAWLHTFNKSSCFYAKVHNSCTDCCSCCKTHPSN